MSKGIKLNMIMSKGIKLNMIMSKGIKLNMIMSKGIKLNMIMSKGIKLNMIMSKGIKLNIIEMYKKLTRVMDCLYLLTLIEDMFTRYVFYISSVYVANGFKLKQNEIT